MKFFSEVHQVINAECLLRRKVKTPNWHQQFGRGNVAERLKLPLVTNFLCVVLSMSYLLSAVREERVRDLMRDRIADACGRAIWIVLDDQLVPRRWDDASIANIVPRDNVKAQMFCEKNRVEGWPPPSAIQCSDDRLLGLLRDDLDWVPCLGQSEH
nr:hypothetical protein [Haliangium ochraceum]